MLRKTKDLEIEKTELGAQLWDKLVIFGQNFPQLTKKFVDSFLNSQRLTFVSPFPGKKAELIQKNDSQLK